MENTDINLKTYLIYVLLMLFVFTSSVAFGQIKVVQFNAGWNKVNDVEWVMGLKDCRTKSYTDIAANPNEAKKYKIAVVPTIIIFKDGEEVARFQADLSFKMVATREEVQEEIDNIIMSDF
jgi:thiol-disulfide isomerase/thioredoxin